MLSSCQSEKIGGGGEGGTLMVDYVYVHSSHRIIHVYGTCVCVRARYAQCVEKRRAHTVPYTVYYIRYALNKQ